MMMEKYLVTEKNLDQHEIVHDTYPLKSFGATRNSIRSRAKFHKSPGDYYSIAWPIFPIHHIPANFITENVRKSEESARHIN